MGTILVVLLLEATRRAMGWPLPVIAIVFMVVRAGRARSSRACCKHSGASWPSLVNHLYLTSQGIYGIAVGVVATYVFHFVLFGVLATRIGLGQLFIDIASAIAGRYAGGPGEGQRVRLGAVRHAVGLVGGERRDGRLADDSRDDPRSAIRATSPAPSKRRRRPAARSRRRSWAPRRS